MSVNFRISNRLSANSSAMRYMDRPPGPSSASRLSKAIIHMEQYHISTGKASFQSQRPKGASQYKGDKHNHNLQSKGNNDGDDYLLKPLRTNDLLAAGRTGSYMSNIFRLGTHLHNIDDPVSLDGSDGKMTPTQKNILISSCLALFTLQNMFLSVETIIPIYLAKQHASLVNLPAAFIMSATEYSGLIFSPIIGSILDKYGRKTIIVLGFLIITIGTVALALLDFVKDDNTFFYLALVVRFIQGIGDQFVQTTTYSVLSSSFPTTREKILGYAETAAGIGLMIGPNIAGPINQAMGYLPAYLVFSVMLVIAGTTAFFLLPNSLNEKPIISQEEFKEEISHSKANAPYSWYFCNRRCMFALMATCILNFFVIFKQAFLTIELVRTFGIDEAYHGLIVSVPALFQIIGAYVVGMLIDKAPKRTWIFIAFIFLSLSDFLMGPSRIFYFNGLSWLFFIGQAINGTGTGMIYTPMLPEIIEAVYEKTELVEGEDENLDAVLADKASGLYFAFFSLGTITAPPMGSVAYSLVNEDWAYTCDVFGIAGAIFTVIYLVFNLLPDIKKERESQKKMEDKILASEIIHQKLGVAPVVSVIEVDKEEENEQRTASHHLQVPQSIWMKKQNQNMARMSGNNDDNLRQTSAFGGEKAFPKITVNKLSQYEPSRPLNTQTSIQ